MELRQLYYSIKPFVPRRVQIYSRRVIAGIKRKAHYNKWPIHPLSAETPSGWRGWPDHKEFALVLSHDVDTARGHDRCIQLMKAELELGFRSSYNFVPEDYPVSAELRRTLSENGFAIGIHGLTHDGKLFKTRSGFEKSSIWINRYLKEWNSVGFHSPSMISNLEWIFDLNIEYDCSTFDTDPFEPQPEGIESIFPILVENRSGTRSYIELPYTLPQDHCLFVILKESTIDIWKEKLDWVAARGGMVLLNSHPDYMNFTNSVSKFEEYPFDHYIELLKYIKSRYSGQYWHALPREVASFWREAMPSPRALPLKKLQKTRHIRSRTIWIDLDNTPHVPFFIPIKRELEKLGFRVVLTARDAYQVCELATRSGLSFKKIGHHHGKNKFLKIYGWLARTLKLIPFVMHERPCLALSHGSRSQVLLAKMLRIPTVVIMDYEHSRVPPLTRPDWEIVPEVITADKLPGKRILKYSGTKEDVYVPFFNPDPGIFSELGLSEQEFLITVRPPATEAHYHNPESELIFSELMTHILSKSTAKVVLLPRNKRQVLLIRKGNPDWFNGQRVIIPEGPLNGLNLIYYSDLVISGGGTMNREAAALGIPVYSIFRGPLGDVDKNLEAEGRLVMLTSCEDVHAKLRLVKREKNVPLDHVIRPALGQIIGHISFIMEMSK